MPIAPTYSLAQYNDLLEKDELLHLLRRCLFGVGQKELAFFKEKTLKQCLDTLLIQSPAPKPLVLWVTDVVDPLVPEGQTWVNSPYENAVFDNRRQMQLRMWWTGNIINRDYSLTAKMALFWHNHFVVEMDVVKDARYSYRYYMLLQTHALGNFKSLVKEGTVNPAMLVYLNGNSSNKTAPNENFSRELMELFTIGKNETQKYSESDVRAAAQVLTGWKDNKNTIEAEFDPALHDANDKQFSGFFNNHVIQGRQGMAGMQEKDELINLIFSKGETARFVCRNLYRWYVSSHIDEQIEAQIIKPLSEIFIAHDFEIAPVLRTLLGSKHFFDMAFRGCIVKSPADYFLGAMQQFDVITSANLATNHNSWLQFFFYMEDLTMIIGDPPSVAGWPAYYQPPKFHMWWVNSASLGMRKKILYYLCDPKGIVFNGPNIKFDFMHFLKQFEHVGDVETFLEEYLELLVALPVSTATRDKLKEILESKQDQELSWAEAWNNYSKNPNDTVAKYFLESRVRELTRNVIILPEFQMM